MGNGNNIHNGHRQRLKDLVRANGLDGMSVYQVLELLLYYAVPQKDTNELAHRLISEFGSLSAVLNADYDSLMAIDGVGPNTASLITLMPELYRRYRQDMAEQKVSLASRKEVMDYISSFFMGKNHEEFYMVCLDAQRNLNNVSRISVGSLDYVTVPTRRVAETALRNNADSVILAHNHPGGDLQPSSADIKLTETMIDLLRPMNISVLDHIIVTDNGCCSFRENAWVNFYPI